MPPSKRAVRWAVLLVFLACCLFIAWNVPYTQDDWAWGTPVGIKRWLSGELNNRYVGTFFVLVMTRSPLLKTLIMGGTMFLLPLLAARLASSGGPDRRFPLVLLGGAALFSMPMVTWRQTFGWVSSFANYILGGAAALILLVLWRRVLREGRPRREDPALAAALFPLSLAAQLFVEHLTAVLLGAALLAAILSLILRRGRLPALTALAGCALGAFLMFHNPLYGQLMAEGKAVEGIRRLIFPPGAGLGEILSLTVPRYVLQLLPGMFEFFPGVCALLSAGCLWRLIRRGAPRWLTALLGLGMGGYSLCCALIMEYQRQNLSWGTPELRAGMALLQLVLVLTVILWAGGQSRWLPLLLVLSAAGLLLPFSLLDEGGPRCAFLSGLALMAAALCLLEDLPLPKWARAGACLLLAAAVGFHVQAYAYIGRNEAARQAQIDRAIQEQADTVLLPTESLRYYYFWGRNPFSEAPWAVEYRQFYGLPPGIQLIILPHGSADCWPDVPPEMLEQAQRFP